MRILNFIGSLLPSFKKNEVTEHLNALRENITSQTVPVFEQAVADMKGGKLNSKAGQAYTKAFNKAKPVPYRGEWMEATLQTLQNMQVNVETIANLVGDSYADTIVVAGMTYKRAQILKYIALMGFVTDYSRQVMLYLLAAEANIKSRQLDEGKERPLPELRWLETNQASYFRALTAMAIKSKDLAEVFANIPDIVITEQNVSTVEETVGLSKVDPLKMNIISIGINPFHYIGIKWADYQVAKYQRAKEEKRAIEFRLEQLRTQRSGREDPKLEQSVAYYEDLVNKLASKIAKFED